MRSERPKHPSGRPIDKPSLGALSRWRIPEKGYVTPRLQEPQRELSLIGFRVARDTDDD